MFKKHGVSRSGVVYVVDKFVVKSNIWSCAWAHPPLFLLFFIMHSGI